MKRRRSIAEECWRGRITSLCAASVLASAAATGVHAGCNDRPGTPTDVSARAISSSSIRFDWRDTTKPGEIPLGPFYDIEVIDKSGQVQPQSVKGQGYLFGGKTFEHLDFDKTYCFRVKARTEQGTQGCVSLRWSARACATTPVPPLSTGVRSIAGNGPWVAVAASGDGLWGYEIAGKTQDDAQRHAKAGCGSASARCTLVRSNKAKCLAYATSEKSGFHFGIGIGETGTSVTTAAMAECGKGAPAGSCKLIDAACRTP